METTPKYLRTPKQFALVKFEEFKKSQPDIFKGYGWGHDKIHAKDCTRILIETLYEITNDDFYKQALLELKEV